MCDEFELYKALFKVFNGMTMLMIYFEKEGIFPNIIEQRGVEKQVYENRFGVFTTLQFPRFKSYEDFVTERGSLNDMTP